MGVVETASHSAAGSDIPHDNHRQNSPGGLHRRTLQRKLRKLPALS